MQPTTDPRLDEFYRLLNQIIDKHGAQIHRMILAESKPFLNAQEIRTLKVAGILDEPDKPRPLPYLTANQTTAHIYTYHRCRAPLPTRSLSGAWTTRHFTLQPTPRAARVLVAKFKGTIPPTTLRNLNRVANGWQPRQRTPKTAHQAVYA